MSKFLLNHLVQISKALVNSKIQFLIQKFFFFAFGPTNLTGPLGLWPSRHRWPHSSRGPKPSLPAQLARASVPYLRKYIFPFGSRLLSWPPPSCLSVKWASAVSFVFSPALPDPGRVAEGFHRAAAPRAARSAPRIPPSPYPPITFPSSNCALTHHNEPNYSAIEAPPSSAVTPPSPPRHPSPGPIKATPMTSGAFHTSLSSSLLLSRTGTPPHQASPTTTVPPRRPIATPSPELQ
jgi:hypothetical protein